MAIFTAVATAVSAAVGGGIFGAVAGFAARTLLTVGITKLIANRTGSTAAGTQDAGSRVQLPPASNNKLPVVYGTAYMSPIVTDAKISTDQKTMWYVCTLAEVTDTGSYTFGDIYWSGKKVVFDGTDTAKVIRLETNEATPQFDDKVNGKIYIYKFPNGSSSGISTGGANAITLLSDSNIPSDQRWNGPIYTTGGQSADMTNTAFIVVKVVYDSNAGTQRLETMSVELTNSLDKPGDVLRDYMTNIRYGCAIDVTNIDTASLTTLNNYSDELITYIPVGGGSALQPRYRINGPINTGQNCLSNLQQLVDDCDSWLQYSELTGMWTIVINKPYDWDGTTIGDLYQVTDDVLISGINVNPIDLNNAYNQLEVQFPDNVVKDQINYSVIKLIDFAPEVMSPNEPENQLTVQYQQVNNYVQAVYLGLRRMLQSREDLTIDFTLDYSGIQIQAGDVITVPFEPYGWEAFNSGYGKLFRVSQVQEAKLDDGSLGARITAFEYNSTVYSDDPIQDYVDSPNTGLSDPNIIGTPNAPTVSLQIANTIAQMQIVGNVPYTGIVTNLDFNVGTDANSANHTFYTTVSDADGLPLIGNTLYTITSGDLSSNTYYWSVTARNRFVGVRSNSSNSIAWTGTNVTNYQSFVACNANSSGTLVTSDSIANLVTGGLVTITSGTGTLQANTRVANIVSNTQFNLNLVPTVALSNACIRIAAGGIGGNNIQANSVTINNMAPGAAGFYSRTRYDPRQLNVGNVVTIQNVTATSTRNIPLKYTGNTYTANVLNTWYSGTWPYAVTNPGNLGFYVPDDAQNPDITESEQGWYKVIYNDLSSDTLDSTEWATITGYINLSTDTANTEIQLVRYSIFATSPSDINPMMRTLQYVNIPKVAPYIHTVPLNDGFTGAGGIGAIQEVGYLIRNITANSVVTAVAAVMTTKQNK